MKASIRPSTSILAGSRHLPCTASFWQFLSFFLSFPFFFFFSGVNNKYITLKTRHNHHNIHIIVSESTHFDLFQAVTLLAWSQIHLPLYIGLLKIKFNLFIARSEDSVWKFYFNRGPFRRGHSIEQIFDGEVGGGTRPTIWQCHFPLFQTVVGPWASDNLKFVYL